MTVTSESRPPALVIGAGSGIGEATVQLLQERRHDVVGWDRTGGGIHCDVTVEDSVTEALAATRERFGVTPSLVVYSAGIRGRGLLTEISTAHWDQVQAVNVRGAFLCLRALAKAMISDEVKGSFVLVSSTSASRPDPGIGAYAVSKVGLEHLARVAALELGEHGIRVNSVAPGATLTPMLASNLADPAYRQAVIDSTPLRATATSRVIAESIVTVLTMSWLHGQTVVVDGGSSLVTPRAAVRLAAMAAQPSDDSLG